MKRPRVARALLHSIRRNISACMFLRKESAGCCFGRHSLLIVGCGTNDCLSSFMKTGPSVSGSSNRTEDDPVMGAEIRLFAAGEGAAGAVVPLLREPLQSDAEESSTLAGSYRCPSPSSQVYLAASGGAPPSRPAVSNSALTMMSVLSNCRDLAGQPRGPSG